MTCTVGILYSMAMMSEVARASWEFRRSMSDFKSGGEDLQKTCVLLLAGSVKVSEGFRITNR